VPTVERQRESPQRCPLACPRVGSRRVPVVLRIDAPLKRRARLRERSPLRQRHQVLPSNVSAAALDPALVVPYAGTAESRLERVVRRERCEARPRHARSADQHLADRGGQVVVGDRRDDAAEVGERGDVSGEKPGRVLLRAEHHEVAPRVHPAHQEEPSLLAHPGELHPDLEEVHLRHLARAVHARHGDLSLRAPKLGYEATDGALAGRVPRFTQ
jgi:hypothetical protein